MAEMIRRLVEAGASPPVVAVAVEAYEYLSRDVTRDMRDTERDIRRKRDRIRQQRKRQKDKEIKAKAEANDAASAMYRVRDEKRDMSRDGGLPPCDLTSLPFLDSEKGKQEREGSNLGVTRARARGTRLSADAQLPENDRQFAVANGVSDPDALWAEFIDYWIGVPGSRGTKLDWSATWRNRVRAIAGKGTHHAKRNGTGARPQRTLQSALNQAREYARGGDCTEPPLFEDGNENGG